MYYILERELFLKNKGVEPTEKRTSEEELKNYGDLASLFPPCPSRYKSLKLSSTWFLKRSVRYRNRSTKNRVAIPLDGLSRRISSSWKSCSADVKGYVKAAAAIIKKRFDEIAVQDNKKIHARRVSMVSSSSTISEGASLKSKFVPCEVHNHNSIEQQQQQQQGQSPWYLSTAYDTFIADSIWTKAFINGWSLGLLYANQLKESPGNCFSALPSIDGLDTNQAAGQYENITYPTVKENTSEGARCYNKELLSLSERATEHTEDCHLCDYKPSAMEVDLRLQYTTEDAGSVSSTNTFGGSESIFHQDPIQFWEEAGQMKQDEEFEWATEHTEDCHLCDYKPSAMEVDLRLQYTTEDAGSVSSTNTFGGSESIFHQDPIQFWEEAGQMKQDEEFKTKGP